jgi:hypothetical protein
MPPGDKSADTDKQKQKGQELPSGPLGGSGRKTNLARSS